jgi:hypothetical protein
VVIFPSRFLEMEEAFPFFALFIGLSFFKVVIIVEGQMHLRHFQSLMILRQ